jgi:hypothetical protein
VFDHRKRHAEPLGWGASDWYGLPVYVRPALAGRRKGQPTCVIAIADKTQQRLCRRFRRLTGGHKPAPKVVVAVARELAGFISFIWAALQRPTAA